MFIPIWCTRYHDGGRLSDQQMALLQYQRENLHFLSEEVLDHLIPIIHDSYFPVSFGSIVMDHCYTSNISLTADSSIARVLKQI